MSARVLLVLFAMTFASLGFAQELNCKVTIGHDKISGVDNEVFNAMQKAVYEFLNQHKWSNDEFQTAEKIDVTVFINLTANKVNNDPEAYSATLSISASRPVFGSTYTSAILNYMDRDFSFKFSQYNSLQFDDNRVTGVDGLSSNLTAVLAYYSYLVLGFDYDSYSPLGGSQYFKKAQNIVNNAPEDKSVSGWKATESSRNRYHIVDQILNTRFEDVRSYWYTMHRGGLDSMFTKPIDARNKILNGLKKVYQVNKENPNSVFLAVFFAAKTEEFVHLVAQAPKNERGQYISLLTAMDVPNAAKYNNLR